jgi:hypothetical protein
MPAPDFKLTVAQDHARDTMISDATHNALGGGSRSGKTFLIIRQIIVRAIKAPGSRHAVFRFRFNALKASVILDTLPKVLRLCFPELPPLSKMLNKSDWYLILPNGSEIWFCGLDDKERAEKVLGMEFATEYFNECSQIPYQSVVTAWSRLAQKNANLQLKCFYDFNPPTKRHWTYLQFIEKRDPLDRQYKRDPLNYTFYLINPEDNKDHLDPQYLDFLDSLPEKARNRFKYGRFADDGDDMLWDDGLLAVGRVTRGEDVPEYVRIVIAVDPSGCKGDEDYRSDEVGITVVGLGRDGHGYLIEDLSGRYSPEDWAIVVNSAFERHFADVVVGEVNYGGDMVRAVLQAHNPGLPFKSVTATRGKVVRAEPISALYQQGKVHHVGHFPEIEDQLCNMTTGGYVGLKSPDRADSLIWALTEIFPSLIKTEAQRTWRPPTVKTASRSASRYDRGQRR